jgi:aspartate/methionine/tyrosine aminotransferase
MFQEFELERWMSANEQGVRYELADSGVPAVALRELVSYGLQLEEIVDLPLHYPEVNGSGLIRERIRALYDSRTAEPVDVLVTVGAAEAAGAVVDALTRRGERVAMMRPNYQQLAGLAVNLGRHVETFSLDPSRGWALRLEELERAASGAAMICVCNPNNPTGHVLSDKEREAVVAAAQRNSAWLVSDEVYVGTEHDGVQTRTLVGMYEKTVAISSLSKAYGLSGLRLGWVAGPRYAVEACWARHEYATIATSALSMKIGEYALDPLVRNALFERNRTFIANGYRTIQEWVLSSDCEMSLSQTRATPVAFLRLPPGLSSVKVGRKLVEDASVLVAPGQYFGGYDDHIRLTAARHLDELRAALDRISSVLKQMRSHDTP